MILLNLVDGQFPINVTFKNDNGSRVQGSGIRRKQK